MNKSKFTVLCVGFTNKRGSPVLAALLEQRLRELGYGHIRVTSTGLCKTRIPCPADPKVVQYMLHRGIDLSGHQTSYIGSIVGPVGLIILDEAANLKMLEQFGIDTPVFVPYQTTDENGRLIGGIESPREKGIWAYIQMIQRAEAAIGQIVTEIIRLAPVVGV